MKELLDKMAEIVDAINGINGYKEQAIADLDFERAAHLRDIAEFLRKHIVLLKEQKPKRPAKFEEIINLLHNNPNFLYEKLFLTPEKAQLSVKVKGEVPKLVVSVKEKNMVAPIQIEWELLDYILVISVDITIDFQEYKTQ